TEGRGATDLVAAGKDLIILRTFSKIYGMAGLRAGAAIARPDLLARIRMYGNTWMPITSLAGAIASLKAPNVVAERRRLTAALRQDLFQFFDRHGFSYLPATANFLMVDGKRPGRDVAAALRQFGVYVGRSWPTYPNHIRVTIGTAEEMEKFKAAFLKAAA
ncbi:MAG: aminotransferase class I/II-fold pyridoxal phosphate-dependent enzyme, partial [Bryobacteraceae bacterium]|nr:aminotransferase class I/II-fold pyridoxal phosphate-dependent enzyme [Bryobacteraceae bacterium]